MESPKVRAEGRPLRLNRRFIYLEKVMGNNSSLIDYKNIPFLRRFITEQGKILSRRFTGVTAKQQREITKAIKQARILGLLQFVNNK